MSIKTIPKELALRLLPDRVLHLVKKVHYARVLRSISEEDEPELKVLRHLVAPGQQVADLGANIGVYTKYLSELVGASGRVYSVEPVPLTFDILRSNVEKLGLKNVELKNCAISDASGYVTMQVPKYERGGDNFYAARIVRGQPDNSLRCLVIPSATIDFLFPGLPSSLHFIKCDVEGHELSCIKGAARTIQNAKPAWLIEVSGNMEDEKSASCQTFRILCESGYEAYWFDGTTLRARRSGNNSVNYFFLRTEHLRLLEERGFPIDR